VHGQIIDFESPDLASGVVYSRKDLDLGEAWMLELMIYLDRYERRDGVWYFQRRTPLYWYETDMTRPPVGEKKLRIPGYEPAEGAFHDAFPSWAEFLGGTWTLTVTSQWRRRRRCTASSRRSDAARGRRA
jgi:hypothetical protein